MALGKWQHTAYGMVNGIAKGSLSDTAAAHLIRGMALFRIKAFDDAKVVFASAENFSSSRKLARQWQQYMEDELIRINQMERP